MGRSSCERKIFKTAEKYQADLEFSLIIKVLNRILTKQRVCSEIVGQLKHSYIQVQLMSMNYRDKLIILFFRESNK